MKLNAKRTFLVGLAFMSISAFWQLYDFAIPLILDQTYGLKETPTGVVMAMDNIAALFLLPLFGALSDRHGKRIPFILFGSVAAAVVSVCMTLVVRQGVAAPVQGQGLWLFLVVPHWLELETVLMSYPMTWLITFVLFGIFFLKFDWLHYLDRKAAKAA